MEGQGVIRGLGLDVLSVGGDLRFAETSARLREVETHCAAIS